MSLFVLVNDLENLGSGVVTLAFKRCNQGWRDVESARLQHQGHECEARRQIVFRCLRRFPKAVMGRKITVIGSKFPQPIAQQREMFCLFTGNHHPAIEERSRQGHGSETRHNIEREIDGVKFDMADGMQERDTSIAAAYPTFGNIAGRHQPGKFRSAGTIGKSKSARRSKR